MLALTAATAVLLAPRCANVKKIRFRGAESASAIIMLLQARGLSEVSGDFCREITDATLSVMIKMNKNRPQRLVYTIEDGKVNGFDLQNNHLNASFDFVFESYNPNRKVSLYYDSAAVLVTYHEQTIAFDSIEPFYQRRHNVTKFGVKPMARSVPLGGKVSNNLRLEQSSGEIVLEVELTARVRIKIGIWKSSRSTLTIFCKNVKVHLDSSKAFERTSCGTHS
ncbi:Late embryogenesis abundant (LEA) hydroxyproline-rich glycoprotein family [Thalictrum thalictroides]|uniref:Late embryogenesis abundant (LEA) hydroxyproline-rich glycoprotein family n=1 Tax=Thalictrum thalictroides TaxID=46969 RepID=A0A7J6WMC4_THATH|nr:Late embryogenesis abundant (LEA) hydroxyproline-rich glycoprotein family [Thalictrum thalictroides]